MFLLLLLLPCHGRWFHLSGPELAWALEAVDEQKAACPLLQRAVRGLPEQVGVSTGANKTMVSLFKTNLKSQTLWISVCHFYSHRTFEMELYSQESNKILYIRWIARRVGLFQSRGLLCWRLIALSCMVIVETIYLQWKSMSCWPLRGSWAKSKAKLMTCWTVWNAWRRTTARNLVGKWICNSV